MNIALRIVGPPVGILIKGSIEIQEIREEPACRNLTSQLVQVEIAVLGQIVHTSFLLPDLNREDCCLTASYSLVGRKQDLAHHATSLSTGVCTIVDGRENHLITATRVNRVHIMNKRLHCLMHPSYSLVNGMLLGTLLAGKTVKRLLDIVHQRLIVQVAIVLAIQILQSFQLFNIAHTHVWSQIEVEGRDSLTTMHLVLGTLHRDTSQNRRRLYTLCRTTGTMTGNKSAGEDIVERMLYTGKRLRRIIILVVDVQIVMLHSIATLFRKQIVIDERLRGLRGKLHHHASRRIGIHICILTCDIIVLDVHDIEEHLTGLRLTRYGTLMAIGNIFLSHILTARFHQLHLNGILNLLHSHLTVATLCYTVCYLI